MTGAESPPALEPPPRRALPAPPTASVAREDTAPAEDAGPPPAPAPPPRPAIRPPVAPPSPAAPPVPAAPEPTHAAASPGPEPASPWERAVRTAIETKPILRAVLGNVRLVGVEGEVATLAAAPGWGERVPRHLAEIAEFLSDEYGRPMRAVLAEGEATPTPEGGPPGGGPDGTPADGSAPRAGPVDVSEHPIVKAALELFGGRIVDVQPRRPAP